MAIAPDLKFHQSKFYAPAVLFVFIAIRAGEPIGYMGLYEVPANEKGGTQTKNQVHVEIFSSDSGIEDFLKNSAGG